MRAIIALISLFALVLAFLAWRSRVVHDVDFQIDASGHALGREQVIVMVPLVSPVLSWIGWSTDGTFRRHGPVKAIALPDGLASDIAAFMSSHKPADFQGGWGVIDVTDGMEFIHAAVQYGLRPSVSRNWEYRNGAFSHTDFAIAK